ncbi:MAG: AAA family ATPase [Capsulimonadaceae bacterium]
MRSRSRPKRDLGPLWSPGFVHTVQLARERVPSFDSYPFNIPAIGKLGTLALSPRVTFLVGENGSGKSTLIEAIAVAAGLNPEGGTKNFGRTSDIAFLSRSTESSLSSAIRIGRGVNRESDGFFLRAESFYNVATRLEQIEEDQSDPYRYYGGKSLHEQSHGESFIALMSNRFFGDGLYILDEPEAALSPSRQLALLSLMDDLVRARASQFIIATHSPLLMAYPGATIYQLDPDGIAPIAYEDTEHYRVTLDFLQNYQTYIRHICPPGPER